MRLPIRITRRTPVWLVLLSLLLALGQYYGWFERPKAALVNNQPGMYHVTEVFDGDTIEVDMNGNKEKVRLIGVDTPETHDPRKPVQCFGRVASDYTKQLIGTQQVRLESDAESQNRDRYNRLLRYVYLNDGRLVQAEVIRGGYGFAYTNFPFSKSEEFKTYEREARANNRGLWANCELLETETSRQVNPEAGQ